MSFAPIMQAVGSLIGGFTQGAQSSYQAQIAKNNSIIARQNAVRSAIAGGNDVEAMGLRNAQAQGGLRASLAASGVDVNSGSAANVQTSERLINSLDTATLANNEALKVYGYETQSVDYKAQEKLDNAESIEAPIGGLFGAAGSYLSNAPNVPEKYSWMVSDSEDSPTSSDGSAQIPFGYGG
jgi:hypothetical protein